VPGFYRISLRPTANLVHPLDATAVEIPWGKTESCDARQDPASSRVRAVKLQERSEVRKWLDRHRTIPALEGPFQSDIATRAVTPEFC
jgi:hypothetical protein